MDRTKPAKKWDTAWRALRKAAGLPWLRFHDLRHTVVTELLEAGEPDHVVESITGHLGDGARVLDVGLGWFWVSIFWKVQP